MPEEQERELKPLPEAESAYLRWLAHLDARIPPSQAGNPQ